MTTRLRLALTALLLVFIVAPAATAELPIVDPRPASQVADGTGRVDAATRREIDELARAARPRGEILVVVTDGTGGEEPRAFATRLFNRVGIGSHQRNDGVLLFLALDDRRAEIVLGDGIAVPTPVVDGIMTPAERSEERLGSAARSAARGSLHCPARPHDDRGGEPGRSSVAAAVRGRTGSGKALLYDNHTSRE